MTDARTLFLQLDQGRPLPVQIRRETTELSLHSGRELRELHGWIVTADTQLHQRLAALLPELSDRRLVRARDERGDFAGSWCVSWNSYAEAAGVHSHTLILHEAEELTLEALLIDGMELYPYEYREEIIDGALTLSAKVVGTQQDVSRLRDLVRERRVFPVVRRGIQDEPREMELGVAEWSHFEDRLKYRLVLVDSAHGGASEALLSRLEMENGQAALSFYAGLLERLSDHLVEKGVLTREELLALRDSAHEGPGARRNELWRVADIDEV